MDLLAPNALDVRALHPGQFQLVASDMAPKTIGIKITDEARSLELDPDGTRGRGADARAGAFVAKVFMGGEFPALKKKLAARFDEVRHPPGGGARVELRGVRAREGPPRRAESGAGRAGRRGEDGSFAGRLGRSGHDRDAGRDGHPGDAGAPGGLDAARRSAPEEAAGPYRRPKGKPAPRAAARKPSTGGRGRQERPGAGADVALDWEPMSRVAVATYHRGEPAYGAMGLETEDARRA